MSWSRHAIFLISFEGVGDVFKDVWERTKRHALLHQKIERLLKDRRRAKIETT